MLGCKLTLPKIGAKLVFTISLPLIGHVIGVPLVNSMAKLPAGCSFPPLASMTARLIALLSSAKLLKDSFSLNVIAIPLDATRATAFCPNGKSLTLEKLNETFPSFVGFDALIVNALLEINSVIDALTGVNDGIEN